MQLIDSMALEILCIDPNDAEPRNKKIHFTGLMV